MGLFPPPLQKAIRKTKTTARSAERWGKMALWAVLLLLAVSMMGAAQRMQAVAWRMLRTAVPKAINAGVKIKTEKEDQFSTPE